MAITKKIRFEVFKRDNFTCQYCGKEAPNIILEIDHIQPKSKNGTDDILNLITSCFECNRGKRDIKLSDKSEIKKQKIELEKLNKRREQLEFLVKWRKEISNIHEEEIDAVENIFMEKTCSTFKNTGRITIKKLIKKYGLKEVLECTDISISQYYIEDDVSSVNKCFDYITKICRNRKLQKEKPYLSDLYYIRGILRNRLYYIDEWQSITLLENAYLKVKDIILLKTISLNVKNWTEFKEAMHEIDKQF